MSNHQLMLGFCVVCVMILLTSFVTQRSIAEIRSDIEANAQHEESTKNLNLKIAKESNLSQTIQELKEELKYLNEKLQTLESSIAEGLSNVNNNLQKVEPNSIQPLPNDNKKGEKQKRKLVVGVLTSYNRPERRMAVRETWLQFLKGTPRENDVDYKFFLADPQNSTLLSAAKAEAKQYGDIVFFEDFVDSYFNVTRKTMSLVKWFVDNYEFDYLFKTDDDAFLRMDRFIDRLDSSPKERYFAGIK